MERRVKFETKVQEKAGREQPKAGPPPRKAATSVGESATAKGQKQPIPFEEFLRRKSNKNTVPSKPKVEQRGGRKPATAGDRPAEAPPKKVEGILRDRSPNHRGNPRIEHEEAEIQLYKLEAPKERSLENIFSNDGQPESMPAAHRHSNLGREDLSLREQAPSYTPAITTQAPNLAQAHNGSSFLVQNSSVVKEEPNGAGKPIRGYFKKEVYGEDANKKEAQARMKRELEEQMEAKRLRKEAEDAKLKAEEAREQQLHAKYLEKQREKQLEEERREQEKKRNREIFAQQQIAVLGEFQNQVTQEKRSKRMKGGAEDEPNIQVAPTRYAVSTASTQQAVSPPTVPFNEQVRPGNTPSSLQTTSNPIERDLVENLLKENQGLKEAANRNNIILDFLTDVLVKKQQLQSGNSMAGNQNPTQSSLGGREDYQTVDGTINSNTGMAQVPNRMRNPNKPFRINTP